jgi:hypothetical protein
MLLDMFGAQSVPYVINIDNYEDRDGIDQHIGDAKSEETESKFINFCNIEMPIEWRIARVTDVYTDLEITVNSSQETIRINKSNVTVTILNFSTKAGKTYKIEPLPVL